MHPLKTSHNKSEENINTEITNAHDKASSTDALREGGRGQEEEEKNGIKRRPLKTIKRTRYLIKLSPFSALSALLFVQSPVNPCK